jgi:hypothetical protein
LQYESGFTVILLPLGIKVNTHIPYKKFGFIFGRCMIPHKQTPKSIVGKIYMLHAAVLVDLFGHASRNLTMLAPPTAQADNACTNWMTFLVRQS